jgi:hypothetical protein
LAGCLREKALSLSRLVKACLCQSTASTRAQFPCSSLCRDNLSTTLLTSNRSFVILDLRARQYVLPAQNRRALQPLSSRLQNKPESASAPWNQLRRSNHGPGKKRGLQSRPRLFSLLIRQAALQNGKAHGPICSIITTTRKLSECTAESLQNFSFPSLSSAAQWPDVFSPRL